MQTSKLKSYLNVVPTVATNIYLQIYTLLTDFRLLLYYYILV